MADSFTQYWNLTKPEVGASRDVWGSKLNVDLDVIDLVLQALCPIGSVSDYAGASVPLGWLWCDGSTKNIADYPKLFAAIGNRYGGDGVSTFAVPNLQGRVTVGVGSAVDAAGVGYSIALGQASGYVQWVIQQGNLPNYALYCDYQGYHSHNTCDAPHGHSVNDPGHAHGYYDNAISGSGYIAGAPGPTGYGVADVYRVTLGNQGTGIWISGGNHTHSVDWQGSHTHNVYLNGSSIPMTLMQPYFGAYKIICCGPPTLTRFFVVEEGAPTFMRAPRRGWAH